MYIFTRQDYQVMILEQLVDHPHFRNILYGSRYGMSTQKMFEYLERIKKEQ